MKLCNCQFVSMEKTGIIRQADTDETGILHHVEDFSERAAFMTWEMVTLIFPHVTEFSKEQDIADGFAWILIPLAMAPSRAISDAGPAWCEPLSLSTSEGRTSPPANFGRGPCNAKKQAAMPRL